MSATPEPFLHNQALAMFPRLTALKRRCQFTPNHRCSAPKAHSGGERVPSHTCRFAFSEGMLIDPTRQRIVGQRPRPPPPLHAPLLRNQWLHPLASGPLGTCSLVREESD